MPSYGSAALTAALAINNLRNAALAQPCPPAANVSLAFNGDSACVDGRIRLTEETGSQVGSIYTASTFSDETYPFETYVEYSIDNSVQGLSFGNGNADGVALVIHNDPDGLLALKSNGCSLGVYNSNGFTCAAGGIANSLVIEFDTFFNGGASAPFSSNFYDRAIDVITTDSNGIATRLAERDASFTLYWESEELWGNPLRIKFWVSYSVRLPGVLDIYFGGEYTYPRPDNPLLSIPVDLSHVFAGGAAPPNQVFCGVSASTAAEFDKHELVSFSGCDEVEVEVAEARGSAQTP